MDLFKIAVFDKLGGQLKNYVDDFILAKENGSSIGYSISDTMLEWLDANKHWYIRVGTCENLKSLPQYLRELVETFIPEFIRLNPEFKGAECLKI